MSKFHHYFQSSQFAACFVRLTCEHFHSFSQYSGRRRPNIMAKAENKLHPGRRTLNNVLIVLWGSTLWGSTLSGHGFRIWNCTLWGSTLRGSTLWGSTLSGHGFRIWNHTLLGSALWGSTFWGFIARATDLGIGTVHLGGLHSGGLLARATDFGSGVVHTCP